MILDTIVYLAKLYSIFALLKLPRNYSEYISKRNFAIVML